VSDYATFWDVPIDEVPQKTGAATVMHLGDIRDVLTNFGLDLSELTVVDVGCGTGRLAQACGDYYGYDIAPGMVAYAQRVGVRAAPIDELAICPTADIVCCLSVFTHISRADRQTYLERFAEIAPLVLVDILPGEEGGYPGVWFADPDDFEADLVTHGFGDFESYSRTSPDGAGHRYYLARL
jgi:SAM-dependent methyltransferase